jgi:hypothetical protein
MKAIPGTTVVGVAVGGVPVSVGEAVGVAVAAGTVGVRAAVRDCVGVG